VPFWKSRGMHQLWWQGAYTENEEKMAESLKNKPALITAMQYCKIRQTTSEEAAMNKVELHSFAYDDFIKNPKHVLSQILSVTGLQNCSSIEKYLSINKIYNRNINPSDFFTTEDKLIMNEMLKDYL
jgi:hypothetical protein